MRSPGTPGLRVYEGGSPLKRTNVYVDGFNLYYGCLQGTPYRWLNIERLCQVMLQKDNLIQSVKYFTAPVKQRYRTDRGPARQDLYLRALATLPCVSICKGRFQEHEVDMPLPGQWDGKPDMVRVVRTDEKLTDVALATALIVDAFKDDYDVAVVITNDADQKPAIEYVTQTLNYPVGVILPTTSRSPSADLTSVASFNKVIRSIHLAKSQFAYNMRDKQGRLDCPAEWRTDYSSTGA